MPICGPCGVERWKRQATSEDRLPTGKAFPLHSPKQFTPAIKMKWCLVLWNYLWKIRNNEDLFLSMAFPALPGAPPPPASAPPLPWLLLWTGCGNSRSQYRGQPAGHCYWRPPSGSLFLLWHHAIRDRETKDDKWQLVGGQRRTRGRRGTPRVLPIATLRELESFCWGCYTVIWWT